jgi:hypothetical protein
VGGYDEGMDDGGINETPGRLDYYNAALVCITLICEGCGATLDPDKDLGPGVSFESRGYYILLGDEAYRRGWKIDASDNYKATCPACAANASN